MSRYRKNVAVIGCGYWGKNLIRNLHDFNAVHTICDKNGTYLDEIGRLYPDVRQEAEFDRVLDDKEIQCIVIATPAVMHYSMARQAIEADKDVFVEKPLSLDVGEGEELVKLAAERGKILMVGHLLEYHPAILKLKDMVNSGELGRIEYIYSSRLNLGRFRTEENILWSFAPHDISVILALLDDVPLHVSAHGGQYLSQDISDVNVITMSFKGGTKAHIFVSWLHPYKEQRIIVVGNRKMAVFDNVASVNKLIVYAHCIEWHGNVPVPGSKKARSVEFDMDEPLKLECQHFLEAVATRSTPRTSGRRALPVLRVLDACQRSLQDNGTVVSIKDSPYYVHPTSIVEVPVTIGRGTRIWHFCHVMRDVIIGENCNIGQNVHIAGNVRIGNNVKIQNNVSVYEGVVLEDNVFCGPSCVFTNVKVPRSNRSQKGMYVTTLVKNGATVGANATIICGNTVGKYALVGAGAVVTRDVPDYAMVLGNPAEIMGWVCECGTRLDIGVGTIICSGCGSEYIVQEFEGRLRIERAMVISSDY
jgi:UDP-2-acetamido-3-amino-2,3-dideoxy-glucuronate N-acetyltransferase